MQTLLAILNRSLPLPQLFTLRITNPPYMTLVIEGIGEGPRGLPAISVAHDGEQNGDPMRDPEMCFGVELKDGKLVDLTPVLLPQRLRRI